MSEHKHVETTEDSRQEGERSRRSLLIWSMAVIGIICAAVLFVTWTVAL